MKEQKTYQQKFDEYREYVKKHPIEWVEQLYGVKLYRYQKILFKMYLTKENLKFR